MGNGNFTSLRWYDEVIKFVFNFAAKTSELLLAAGVVISTANFLTDGSVMQANSSLYVAWSWAQALAIDSSLGIVFMNGFQAVREREKIKAFIFFSLTAILATVAGLLTDFDALSHASGVPLKDVSSIVPLWILTALRAVAVVGFLLTSRLKNFSFNDLRQEAREPLPEAVNPLVETHEPLPEAVNPVKYRATKVVEEDTFSMFLLPGTAEEAAEMRIARAYEEIKKDREHTQDWKPISARELAQKANVRRSTCSEWLKGKGISQEAGRPEEEEQKGNSRDEPYEND